MKRELLSLLVCPGCQGALSLQSEGRLDAEIQEGALHCAVCAKVYTITGGIPRFVPPDNYAATFGHQWNRYAALQLDSRNGTSFSRDRFYSITEWKPEDLRGKRVLDVGCGAGRFAEVALAAGANVVAVDLSSAVDACYGQLGSHPGLSVVQASIYDLPFRDRAFDLVYSIGVVQHTPEPKRSVECMAEKVAPGGRIGLWIYELNWKSFVGTLGFKYLLRPWTRRQTIPRLELFCDRLERRFWPLVRWGRNHGAFGKLVMRLLPVCSAHLQQVPLPENSFRQWVLLDTFDMYSPAHDHPQRFQTVKQWLERAGFSVERRHPHGAISITGKRRL